MLIVEIFYGDARLPDTASWHVGEGALGNAPVYAYGSLGKSREIISGRKLKDFIQGDLVVTADGDELHFIWSRFQGIPHVGTSSTNTWRGDFARFIVDNLK